MPATITRDSLMTLEAYSTYRKEHKPRIMAHRKRRSLPLGEHVTVQFEDETTIRYQFQEMLRIEKIFEEDGIQHEIDACTPLVPDGSNWKATMLIEYPDPAPAQARAGAADRRRGPDVRRGRRPAAHLRDRRRGPRTREQREDLVGPLPALRVSAGSARCAPVPT